ncbi:MAG: response regulator [Rhodocyclaceae bacterium]|nr:response regulator [Rhodocyclaceae bacterium]
MSENDNHKGRSPRAVLYARLAQFLEAAVAFPPGGYSEQEARRRTADALRSVAEFALFADEPVLSAIARQALSADAASRMDEQALRRLVAAMHADCLSLSVGETVTMRTALSRVGALLAAPNPEQLFMPVSLSLTGAWSPAVLTDEPAFRAKISGLANEVAAAAVKWITASDVRAIADAARALRPSLINIENRNIYADLRVFLAAAIACCDVVESRRGSLALDYGKRLGSYIAKGVLAMRGANVTSLSPLVVSGLLHAVATASPTVSARVRVLQERLELKRYTPKRLRQVASDLTTLDGVKIGVEENGDLDQAMACLHQYIESLTPHFPAACEVAAALAHSLRYPLTESAPPLAIRVDRAVVVSALALECQGKLDFTPDLVAALVAMTSAHPSEIEREQCRELVANAIRAQDSSSTAACAQQVLHSLAQFEAADRAYDPNQPDVRPVDRVAPRLPALAAAVSILGEERFDQLFYRLTAAAEAGTLTLDAIAQAVAIVEKFCTAVVDHNRAGTVEALEAVAATAPFRSATTTIDLSLQADGSDVAIHTDLVAILSEEFAIIAPEMEALLGRAVEGAIDLEGTTVLRRHFHTLKGSSATVLNIESEADASRTRGRPHLSYLAFKVEELLNTCIAFARIPSVEASNIALVAYTRFKEALPRLCTGTGVEVLWNDVEARVAAETALVKQPPTAVAVRTVVSPQPAAVPEAAASEAGAETNPAPSVEYAELTQTAQPVDSQQQTASHEVAAKGQVTVWGVAVEAWLFDAFVDDITPLLQGIDGQYLGEVTSGKVSHGLLRAVHTIASLGTSCGLLPLNELGRTLEDWVTAAYRQKLIPSRSESAAAAELLQRLLSLAVDALSLGEVVPQYRDAIELFESQIHARVEAVPTSTNTSADFYAIGESLEVAVLPEVTLYEKMEMDPEPQAVALPEPLTNTPIESVDVGNLQSEQEVSILPNTLAETHSAVVDACDVAIEPTATAESKAQLLPEIHSNAQPETSVARELAGEFHAVVVPEVMVAALADLAGPAGLVTTLPGDGVSTSANSVSPAASRPARQAGESTQDEFISLLAGAVAVSDLEIDAIDEQVFNEIFAGEAAELVASAKELLPLLGQADAHEVKAALERDVHTLKGGARMSGAMRLGAVLHSLEDALFLIGRGVSLPLTPAALVHIATILDVVSVAIENEGSLAIAEAPATLFSAEAPATRSTLDVSQDVREQPNLIAVSAAPLMPTVRKRTVRIDANTLSDMVSCADQLIILEYTADRNHEDMASALQTLHTAITSLQTLVREVEVEADAQLQSTRPAIDVADETFTPLELDRHTRLHEVSKRLAERAQDTRLAADDLGEVSRALGAVENLRQRLSGNLQRSAASTMLVSLSTAKDRLARIVRQACNETGKAAEFVLQGDVQMHSAVLDKLMQALEHLLRNSVAHGIESSADRLAAHKPSSGLITLECSQAGNELRLRLKDDGGGIAIQRVHQKGVSLGFLHPTASTRQEIIDVIFRPGFSTAASVSQIAGRGVGMDVVRAVLAELGGEIIANSVDGYGVSFDLRLPVDTSVIATLPLRTGELTTLIPVSIVDKVVAASLAPVVEGHVTVGDEVMEFYRLADLLRQPNQHDGQPKEMLVLRGAKKIAIGVDDVGSKRRAVLKPIGRHLRGLPGLLGMTVSDRGDALMVLNPAALVSEFASHTPDTEHQTLAKSQVAKQLSVMVVDDSLTVRRVTSRFLTAHNMESRLALDGRDAIEQIHAEGLPDIILLDLEMPRMGGYEFAEALRNYERALASEGHESIHTPVIMITSRSRGDYFDRALAIGVDVCMSKPYQEKELLETIARLTAAHQESGSLC